MLDIKELARLSQLYNVPREDALFIALNTSGVNFQCGYNRIRTALRLENDNVLFGCAMARKELDYYFALPINKGSAFTVKNNLLLLRDVVIGRLIGLTEDICDSHYPRRNGTSLNINPNSRTSCRGCDFCYTAYQVPCDRKKLKNKKDLEIFFENWMREHDLTDLSHLIQVSLVTGCYDNSRDLCRFLLTLKQTLNVYRFNGTIFYLGSQITQKEELRRLAVIKPFSVCYSLETFERRDLLRDKKRSLDLNMARALMDFAMGLGYAVSFSYIIGIEPLGVVESHFERMRENVNKFPIINTLQMHKYHKSSLADPSASDLEYYLKARKLFERIFSNTDMRPLVWENYRSLWFLMFDKEPLYGIRIP
jgi:hypothetical protein